MQYVDAHTPSNSHNHGAASFESFQFVDGAGFDAPALGLRPWMCVGLWERALRHTFGTGALNKERKAMEGQYGTRALTCGGFGGY